MKPKMWLAVGGAVVVIVIVVLWLMSGGGGGNAAKGTGSAGLGSATTVALSDPNAPKLPSIDVDKVMAEGSDVKILPDGTREYHRGNMIVRDHRKGGSADDKPFEYAGSAAHPNALGNERHKMDASVVSSLRPGISDALAQCGHDVPADMRGPKPSMRATVTLAVTGGKVTVTKTQIDLVDVVGNAVEPTKACLDTKIRSTVTTTAPNEPDMTDYMVTVQMPVP